MKPLKIVATAAGLVCLLVADVSVAETRLNAVPKGSAYALETGTAAPPE
jgi:hypothetical protein